MYWAFQSILSTCKFGSSAAILSWESSSLNGTFLEKKVCNREYRNPKLQKDIICHAGCKANSNAAVGQDLTGEHSQVWLATGKFDLQAESKTQDRVNLAQQQIQAEFDSGILGDFFNYAFQTWVKVLKDLKDVDVHDFIA